MTVLPTLDGYEIRSLNAEDLPWAQSLFESDPVYFEQAQGAPARPDETATLMTELPPGKNKDDKFVFGVFDKEDELFAVVDAVRGYPEPAIWFLGFIFVAPAYRGKGFGRALLQALMDWARAQGGDRLRLGVVEPNAGARRLYERIGFREIARRERKEANGYRVAVRVMEVPL